MQECYYIKETSTDDVKWVKWQPQLGITLIAILQNIRTFLIFIHLSLVIILHNHFVASPVSPYEILVCNSYFPKLVLCFFSFQSTWLQKWNKCLQTWLMTSLHKRLDNRSAFHNSVYVTLKWREINHRYHTWVLYH